jgi:tetratricopeptide (TPR) repeat protein
LSRDLKDRWGEAASLDSAYHHLGRHREAVRYFEQALAINRELGHLYSEALDYDHLGDALDAAGDAALARDAWQRALEILGQLGDVYSIGRGYPDPDVIRAKLRTRDRGGQRAY